MPISPLHTATHLSLKHMIGNTVLDEILFFLFFFSLNQQSLYSVPFLFRMQRLRAKCHQENKCFKNEVLIMSYGPDRKLREEPAYYFSSWELRLECVKMLFIFRLATWAWHHVNPKCLWRFPWGLRKNHLYG